MSQPSKEQLERRKHLHIELPKTELFSESYRRTSQVAQLSSIFGKHLRNRQWDYEQNLIFTQLNKVNRDYPSNNRATKLKSIFNEHFDKTNTTNSINPNENNSELNTQENKNQEKNDIGSSV